MFRSVFIRSVTAAGSLSLALMAIPALASDAEEKFEIIELMNRYGVVHDFGSPEEYADLYTEDGEIGTQAGNTLVKGRDGLIAQQKRDHEKYVAPTGPNGELEPFMRHLITNPMVKLTGPDTAEGSCYVITMVRDGDNGPALLSFSRYSDRYRKVNGEWKIARREIIRGFGNPELGKKLGFR